MAKFIYSRAHGGLVDKDTGEPLCVPDTLPDGFTGPQVVTDLPEHTSPVTGEVLGGRRDRREHMKRYDLREVEPSERPQNLHKTKEQAAKEKAHLEERRKSEFSLDAATKKRLLG